MNKALVSIILATYNREDFLDQTLESLVNQSYQNIEIIIVDDGSVESMKRYVRNIVDKIDDNRIKTFFLEQNRGVAYALTYGMDNSEGDYIAHIGSDDLWHKDNISQQIEVIQKDKSVGLSFTDVARINKRGEILHNSRFQENIIGPIRGLSFKRLYLKGLFVPGISVMFDRNVYKKVGGLDDSFSLSNDYDFFLRMAQQTKFDYVDNVLAYWRMHDNNLHDLNKIQTYKERLEIINKHEKYALSNGIPKWRIALKRSNLLIQIGLEHANSKEFNSARNDFVKALLYAPFNILALLLFLNTFFKIGFLWNLQLWKNLFFKIFK